MRGYWTCRRRVDGRLCMERSPNRKRKCPKCGGPKPSKRRPKHMAALDTPYEEWVTLNGGERCAICLRPRSEKDKRLQRDHDHLSGCDGRAAVRLGDLAADGARTLCGERARQGDTPRQQQGGDPT